VVPVSRRYRAVDEHGQVVDVLLREHRDTASAKAFFKHALGPSDQVPSAIITNHHRPCLKAIQRAVPTAVHIRSWVAPCDWGNDQAHRARSCTDA
jgi:transposase-like protein